jgi:peptidoglycan hydrolase-like protein with peptidoglycan-binding domain
MRFRACVVFCLAACANPAPSGSTTDYVVVQKGRRAWPVHDQALVRNLQERLAAEGFDPGRRDGVSDDRTRQTLAAFQEAHGLPATGALDEATSEALGLRWRRVRDVVRAGRLEPVL